MTEQKRCSKCKEDKPVAEFRKDRGAKDGFYAWCKQCAREYDKDRYERPVARSMDRTIRLVRAASSRARKKGIPFDLSEYCQDLEARLARGVCERTGYPFNFEGGRTWDSPSFDRVVPEKGYVYSNIQVVCLGLNSAFGSWGEQGFWRLALGLAREHLKKLFREKRSLEWNATSNA